MRLKTLRAQETMVFAESLVPHEAREAVAGIREDVEVRVMPGKMETLLWSVFSPLGPLSFFFFSWFVNVEC